MFQIYPSEFGLKRLENEECFGPEEIVQPNSTTDNNSNIEVNYKSLILAGS